MKKNFNQINLKYIFFSLFKYKIKFILLTLLVFGVIFYQIQKKHFLQKSQLSYHVVVAKQVYIENVEFLNLNYLKLEDFTKFSNTKKFYSKLLGDLNSKELFSQFIYLNQKKYNLKFEDFKIANSFAVKNLKYQEKSDGNRIILNYTPEIDGVKLLNDYCNYVINIAKEKLINEVLNRYLVIELLLTNHLEIAKKLNITLPLPNANVGALSNVDALSNIGAHYQHGTIVLSKLIADNNDIIENIKNLNIEFNLINESNVDPYSLKQNSKKLIISLSFLVSICISLFIYLIIILFRNKKINF